MAMETIKFELVSPERLLMSRDVDMVVVPGEEGDFGVLPGHALFLTLVRPGLIDIYKGDEVSDQIFVAGGQNLSINLLNKLGGLHFGSH